MSTVSVPDPPSVGSGAGAAGAVYVHSLRDYALFHEYRSLATVAPSGIYLAPSSTSLARWLGAFFPRTGPFAGASIRFTLSLPLDNEDTSPVCTAPHAALPAAAATGAANAESAGRTDSSAGVGGARVFLSRPFPFHPLVNQATGELSIAAVEAAAAAAITAAAAADAAGSDGECDAGPASACDSVPSVADAFAQPQSGGIASAAPRLLPVLRLVKAAFVRPKLWPAAPVSAPTLAPASAATGIGSAATTFAPTHAAAALLWRHDPASFKARARGYAAASAAAAAAPAPPIPSSASDRESECLKLGPWGPGPAHALARILAGASSAYDGASTSISCEASNKSLQIGEDGDLVDGAEGAHGPRAVLRGDLVGAELAAAAAAAASAAAADNGSFGDGVSPSLAPLAPALAPPPLSGPGAYDAWFGQGFSKLPRE